MTEAIPIAIFWAVMLLLAMHLGLALAAASVPAITSLTGLHKAKRLKIFINKFGQQSSTFALLGGLWVFVVLCAALAALWFLLPEKAPYVCGIPLPLAAVAGPVILGAAAFLAYRGLWQRLKNQKVLHAVIGLAATVLLWIAFYTGLATLRPLSLALPAPTGPEFLLPPAGSLFWRLLALGITLSISLAGIFTGAWLVWRRDKDDFGRDYYNFTLRLTARIGFLGQIAVLAAMGWLLAGFLPLVGELSRRLTIAVALYGTGTLLTLLCLGVVMPQENALRHKLMLVAAFLTTLMALTGLFAGLTSIFFPAVFTAPVPLP
ncbi:conserved hypothetical protein [Solidesulfovibrio fructosivorans JJ]]|uniref:Uncharacterized protein n=1 Tax=Solidesulfovibrio fructosivorans JJ] TaxID=596151 RepID=E1JZI1_SOLFR|nr:hypothetical protein [Solidesulfovibrio fructosivorans]EFL50228.1 conserved hypothetical protein [Solidesulfovibrio fructosivorans JJ]]